MEVLSSVPTPPVPARPRVPVPAAVLSFGTRLEEAFESISPPTPTPGAGGDETASTSNLSALTTAAAGRTTLGAMVRASTFGRTAVTAAPSITAAQQAVATPTTGAVDATSAVARGAAVTSGAGVLAGRLVATPVDGRVSSTFGPRIHPITGSARDHHGLDVAAPSGTPVRSLTDGTVVSAGERGGYGLVVEIDHGDGVTSRYAHLSAIDVSVGDRLDVGAVLGEVGSTGFSTGPHLHLEVRVDDDPIDPETVLG